MSLYPTSVLIIEDQPEICDLIELTLVDKVNHIYKAHSFLQARKIVNDKVSLSLAVIDTCLPDGDPYDLIKELTHIGCKILLMSGNFELNKKLANLPLPRIDKPFRINTLITLIEETLISNPTIHLQPIQP